MHQIHQKRKRTTAGKGLFFLTLFLCCLLTGCGAETKVTDSDMHSDAGPSSKTSADVIEGKKEGTADSSELQEKLRCSAVHISGTRKSGSGIITGGDDGTITVYTAYHVKDDEEALLQFAWGSGLQGVWDGSAGNAQRDLGVLLCRPDSESDAWDLQYAADNAVVIGMKPIKGQEIAVLGSVNDAADTFATGYVLEPTLTWEDYLAQNGDSLNEEDKILLREELLGAESMIYCELHSAYKNTDTRQHSAVDAGMSGAGVFDTDGNLLGMIVGGDGEGRFLVTPVYEN